LLVLKPSFRYLSPQPLYISHAWPQLWQAQMSRAPVRFLRAQPSSCNDLSLLTVSKGSVVVGPRYPGTFCRWALPSSFAVEFLLSVNQASRQRLAWPQLRETFGPKVTDLPGPSPPVAGPGFYHLFPTSLSSDWSSLICGELKELARCDSCGPTLCSDQHVCTLSFIPLCSGLPSCPALPVVNAGIWISGTPRAQPPLRMTSPS